MFSQTSVILFTWGVDTPYWAGTPLWPDTPWADMPPKQTPPPGQTPPLSRWLLQRTVCILLECILITTRNKVRARLCFYMCLILFTGGLPQCMLGITPRTRHPPMDQTPPSGADPPDQIIHPPGTRHSPQEHTPLGSDTSLSEQCMLGDTGNKRAVRILLECILVIFCRWATSPNWRNFSWNTERTTSVPLGSYYLVQKMKRWRIDENEHIHVAREINCSSISLCVGLAGGGGLTISTPGFVTLRYF